MYLFVGVKNFNVDLEHKRVTVEATTPVNTLLAELNKVKPTKLATSSSTHSHSEVCAILITPQMNSSKTIQKKKGGCGSKNCSCGSNCSCEGTSCKCGAEV